MLRLMRRTSAQNRLDPSIDMRLNKTGSDVTARGQRTGWIKDQTVRLESPEPTIRSC